MIGTILSVLVVMTQVMIPSGWRTYTNVQYGYSLCYPQSFHPSPETSDGRSFRDGEGVTVRVWGSNNVLNTTLAQETSSYSSKGEVVTYKVNRPLWIAESGMVGQQIFWRKIIQNKDQYNTVEIRYPTAHKDVGDAVTKVISSCFHAGHPAF